ncbi:glycosyl transferase [Oscillatoriales cyanobacterium USR001]|nr:glycosyl transferase [Oscillatoriales cyanobacterium USR001]
MLKKLFQQKLFKFLIGGGVAAIINLLLIFLMIEKLGFDTPALRNIANVVSIEISLLASFFIYRIWVWPGGSWTFREVLWRQIPLYHLSAGTAVIARIFIVFPLLDWLKVNYAINTLVGVLLSATLNYLISDRFVFKTPVQPSQKSIPFSQEIYYPEVLAAALENSSFHPKQPQSEKSTEVKLFSIIIPAHNEEGCVVQTVESIAQLLEEKGINYEIIVVNDNSRDRTEELLQKLTSQNSKIRYVNNYFPNGFGFAIRCGLENFQGDAVAIVMADNSDSPENIVDYYYQLQAGYDCVFGSRFIKGSKVVDYPTHKLLINRLANLFIQILFGFDLNDTTNAFKAYRREVIEGIYPLLSHHFNLTVEMPLKSIVRGYSYKIIPITWQNRKVGISKLKIKEMGSRYLFIVLFIWLEKHFSRGDYLRKQP